MANSEGLNSAIEELNSLIGLESVKSDIQSMINLVRMNQMRKEKGQTVPNVSLHMVFTGNPGTGKTVVARLLATIYKEIGVLSKGQLIETARQDLVAQYIGHTAIKTKQVIDSAKGGILFIDEAYTLYKKGNGNDFGQEAIDTLLKEMEDNRGDLIVIVAGYPKEMGEFLQSNPGLQSRFNKKIAFPDYNARELRNIFNHFCHSNGIRFLTQQASTYMDAIIEKYAENHGSNFANARDMRNFFERAYQNQANRLISYGKQDNESIETFLLIDVAGITRNMWGMPELTGYREQIDNDLMKNRISTELHRISLQKPNKEKVKTEPHDSKQEAEWYFRIGIDYQKGTNGKAEDHKEAINWLRKSADLGNGDAYNALGICYEMGDGVTKDLNNAFKYYSNAAQHASNRGIYNVGRCYEYGIGIPKDLKKASEMYKKCNIKEAISALNRVEAAIAGVDNRPKTPQKSSSATTTVHPQQIDIKPSNRVETIDGRGFKVSVGTKTPKKPLYCLRCLKPTNNMKTFGSEAVQFPVCLECLAKRKQEIERLAIQYVNDLKDVNKRAKSALRLSFIVSIILMIVAYLASSIFLPTFPRNYCIAMGVLIGVVTLILLSNRHIQTANVQHSLYLNDKNDGYLEIRPGKNSDDYIFTSERYAEIFAKANGSNYFIIPKQEYDPEETQSTQERAAKLSKKSYKIWIFFIITAGLLYLSSTTYPNVHESIINTVANFINNDSKGSNIGGNGAIGKDSNSEYATSVVVFSSDDEYSEKKANDTGEEIKSIQQRLSELGYNVGTVDGIWGNKTTQAIALFNEKNYVDSGEIASVATQRALFSDHAIGADDKLPKVYIQDEAVLKYKKNNTNIEVLIPYTIKGSSQKSISNIDIKVICVNTKGNESASEDYSISFNDFLMTESTKTAKYTDPIILHSTDKVAEVVCIIKGIQYDDGQYFSYMDTSYTWIVDENAGNTLPGSSTSIKESTKDPTKAPTAKPTTKPAAKTSEAEPLNMTNGQIVIKPDYNCLCTLEIKTDSSSNYYVYLDYIGAPENSYNQRSLNKNAKKPYEEDMAFYVKAGSTVQVEVPIGVYEMYYASGKEFYGPTEKFGDKTSYSKADATFDFYTTKTQTSGYTVTLYKVENGNMDTDPISESQFPG